MGANVPSGDQTVKAYLYWFPAGGYVVAVDEGGPGASVGLLLRVSNRPNPFRSTTTIEADVARPGPLTADVFDISGRRVRHLETMGTPGRVRLEWDGRATDGSRAPVGTYFAVVRSDGQVATRKVIQIH
ncbi:MAG: T9SS type A sorting domain-containing protein [Candidatus Eisenbacteria bacterium]|nr:T9SS type A sorting domain-containing protein [Candidatus Eisenbacteria bacterium]